MPSGHCPEAQELTLPQAGEAHRAGARPPSTRHLPSAALQFQFYAVSFLFCCVSLPSFSFLPHPGGGRQSLGRPDAVSLESTEEGAWNCFTVAGQIMESSRRLGLLRCERHARGSGQAAADFTFGVTKDENPRPRNLDAPGTFSPTPTGSAGSRHPPVPRGLRVMKCTDRPGNREHEKACRADPGPARATSGLGAGEP